MGAASASAQSSAMPQSSQGKGGGAPTGGSGAPTGGGKGFANQGLNEFDQPKQVNSVNSIEDTYQNVLGRAPDAGGLKFWQENFGADVDAGELERFKMAAQPELDARPQPTRSQGKGGGAPMNAPQGNPGEPQLPTGSQQGWQYGQGTGDRVTYPTTSGQQQFGQPMQGATGSSPYSNTIQSNQSSGKGKGA